MSDQQELFARISDLRREYTRGRLRRKDLPDCPSVLFDHWLRQACDAKLPDPTAMCVATVDDRGQPFQRIVLLKQVNHESMTFYTNLGSRKAQHIQQNAKVSLHFPWYFLERQVMVQGVAEKLSFAEVAGYFHSRPRDSQIGAWVSPQSRPVSGRAVLEEKFLEMTQKFIHEEVPLPDFWGGYRVRFHTMEFWQGGCHRLHDRFLYEKQDQQWKIQRLAP